MDSDRRPAAFCFRPAAPDDVDAILNVQEPGAVQGLGHIFPQAQHPFPRDVVRARWESEIVDPRIAVYVATAAGGRVVGFAARRDDELLHFGTAVETWGTSLATSLHDELLATFPAGVTRLRLRVFAENRRARRFYERCGWTPTGAISRTSYEPFPVLVEYARLRSSVTSG